jgi:hypothetical protein
MNTQPIGSHQHERNKKKLATPTFSPYKHGNAKGKRKSDSQEKEIKR